MGSASEREKRLGVEKDMLFHFQSNKGQSLFKYGHFFTKVFNSLYQSLLIFYAYYSNGNIEYDFTLLGPYYRKFLS